MRALYTIAIFSLILSGCSAEGIIAPLYESTEVMYGSIEGVVTTRGEPVPDAIVRIEPLGIADTTDDHGIYQIRNVPVGRQLVSFTRDGFSPRIITCTFSEGIATKKDVTLGLTSAIPEYNLELYVPFNGDIGDRSPQAHQMALMSNRVTFVTDRHGRANNAVQFNGANGVTTLDGNQMNFASITMAAWVKIPSYTSATNRIIGKSPEILGDGYYIVLDHGDLVFMWGKPQWPLHINRFVLYREMLPTSEWMWVGFAMNDDGTGYVTLNGKSVKLITTSVNRPVNTEQFTIGDLPTNSGIPGFGGSMDQVVVYSRYKTVDELKAIMEAKD